MMNLNNVSINLSSIFSRGIPWEMDKALKKALRDATCAGALSETSACLTNRGRRALEEAVKVLWHIQEHCIIMQFLDMPPGITLTAWKEELYNLINYDAPRVLSARGKVVVPIELPIARELFKLFPELMVESNIVRIRTMEI